MSDLDVPGLCRERAGVSRRKFYVDRNSLRRPGRASSSLQMFGYALALRILLSRFSHTGWYHFLSDIETQNSLRADILEAPDILVTSREPRARASALDDMGIARHAPSLALGMGASIGERGTITARWVFEFCFSLSFCGALFLNK